MNDKILNLLGMARRANKVSMGHDAAITDFRAGKVKLCVLSVDASQRLKDEMAQMCSRFNSQIIVSVYSMQQLGMSLGSKSIAVLTINDDGFAKRIIQLTLEE